MGSFEAKVRVSNLEKPERFADLSLVVDTGATLSWIPRQILEGLEIEPLSRLPFTLADGRVLQREIGGLLLTIDGRRGPLPVAFAESGEHSILGATALETLGMVVDPVGEKLIQRNLLALRSQGASAGAVPLTMGEQKANISASTSKENHHAHEPSLSA